MHTTPEIINLLYIEDDTALPDVITECLDVSEYIKFNIVVKTTLEDGIKYLQDNHCSESNLCEIDIILLDLILPNSEGVDTFRSLKKRCNFLPIVVISGYEDMAYECVRLGAQDYLVKPDIDSSILIRSIQHSIARTKLENEVKNIIRTSSLGYHMYKLENDELIFCGYNPASSKILGVDNGQFLNKEITEAFPNLPTEVPIMYRRAIEKGEPWVNQVIEYGDSNIDKAYYRVNAYRTAENSLTVTFEDITEQVTIGEALKKSDAKYRNLVEVTRAGICKLNYITEKFVYVNDVLCKNFGWSREELLTMGPVDVLTKPSMLNFVKRMEAIKRGEFIDNVFEYEAYKKDGSIFWGMTTARYIEDEDKNVIGANVVIIDITQQKLQEEELKKQKEEVYVELENKIQEWKKELVTRNIKNERHLKLIDKEILSLNNVGEV